jgi:hypothetical protein
LWAGEKVCPPWIQAIKNLQLGNRVTGRRFLAAIALIMTAGACAVPAAEEKAWEMHAQALELYYGRNFETAGAAFAGVRELLPDDFCAGAFMARCAAYAKSPPPQDWTGIEEMKEK